MGRLATIYANYLNDKAEQIIRDFRSKARIKFDDKQGAIKKALLEAIGEWSRKN